MFHFSNGHHHTGKTSMSRAKVYGLLMALAMLLVCAGCWAGRPVHCIIADMYWMQAFSGGFAPEEKKVLSEG